MVFDEHTVNREADGKFGESRGSDPEPGVLSSLSPKAQLHRLIASDELPRGFRYEVVENEENDHIVVTMHAVHGTPREDYIDITRSRIGNKLYQPEVRAAISKLESNPAVVNVIVREDDPPFHLEAASRRYDRRGINVAEVTLRGEQGTFSVPVPVSRATNVASIATYLVEHNQDAVLDKVVGEQRRREMFRAFKPETTDDFELSSE